jgi:hypothetical protein
LLSAYVGLPANRNVSVVPWPSISCFDYKNHHFQALRNLCLKLFRGVMSRVNQTVGNRTGTNRSVPTNKPCLYFFNNSRPVSPVYRPVFLNRGNRPAAVWLTLVMSSSDVNSLSTSLSLGVQVSLRAGLWSRRQAWAWKQGQSEVPKFNPTFPGIQRKATIDCSRCFPLCSSGTGWTCVHLGTVRDGLSGTSCSPM